MSEVDYSRMYVQAIERSHRWMDQVMENVAAGDYSKLIDDVGDALNGVDAVDDDSIALFERAQKQAAEDMKALGRKSAIEADIEREH